MHDSYTIANLSEKRISDAKGSVYYERSEKEPVGDSDRIAAETR